MLQLKKRAIVLSFSVYGVRFVPQAFSFEGYSIKVTGRT